ncbi:hypothetical protein BZG02_08700 [Labilibaculum filiforme]|uniref:MotA/TolQ/ExbB proton channel domain-containing protein n=1 Tax=Labilibaculum filiforme TaxID=1940526 RepID=A0A2N3HZE8_9BACT|nr:hypothetical protein [Labilibaculum filiforme]PKQ63448.1 hypothetical protein BZG02_08700 [Labilibaculum filiforme]
MKDLFITGGSFFMWVLTLLLIITVAWIIYHFILAYSSKQTDKAVLLRKLGYGKSIGLFALMSGILGQMFGFFSMFIILEEGVAKSINYAPSAIFEGLETTTIVPSYGILIYLLSLLLWFSSSILIEKKQENQYSA